MFHGPTHQRHPGYQTPRALRRIGRVRLETWLRKRGVRSAAAGDLTAYRDAGHLASAAGLLPVPRDSGLRTGNLHRPKRYNRALRRVFFMSALSSLRTEGSNREFYQRKRAEGLKHVQAVIALARRRVSVVWALLRDGRVFTPAPPVPQAA
ncbi:transposase [Nocardiopsis aegyptia]|uniref:Transposase n=1 Tax=Nocardiopsis aegyptia TaxID=220378 RepID=A0A7Z0EVQ4_9ACTN|nr:transposase [Nocardiopsis aegyptia]